MTAKNNTLKPKAPAKSKSENKTESKTASKAKPKTTSKIENNLKNLLTYFEEKGFLPELQEERSQLQITIESEKVEFPLFVRITDDAELIQLLAFFPSNIKQGHEADTARALHLLNKELDIPGFGMDDINALIFYRCMIPCPENQFNVSVLDKFSNAIPLICESFFPLIYSISQGNMKFEDMATQYEKMRFPEETQKENEQCPTC